MSNLTGRDKVKLEKFFGMETGYVLGFSNNTFSSFIQESVGIDIFDKKYNYHSGSKANRLRRLWIEENDLIVSKVIFDLLEYWKAFSEASNSVISETEQRLYNECVKIAERLKQDSFGVHIDAIQADFDDKNYNLLAKSIRESIEKNEPEVALDRLHTYVVKYIRNLCSKHNIKYDKTKPLHSFFGEYVKHLQSKNLIESQMTVRILKSTISILEAFNEVRNNKSFAHDNQILNYNESILIFKSISSIIDFINKIESHIDEEEKKSEICLKSDNNDLPF